MPGARGAGRNSRIYRVRRGSEHFAVKHYPSPREDPRDRLKTEVEALQLMERNGARIALSPIVVECRSAPMSWGEVWAHQIRWARTIRSIAPVGFAASFMTHSVMLALIAVLAGGFTAPTLAVLAIALACRLVMVRIVDRALKLPATPPWLVPVRDMLSFWVFIVSFLGKRVAWRDNMFRIGADGRLVTNGDGRA